ncbi:MAG: helix-turn-helix transcriptional regulator [Bradyrhizobium sp.]
MLNQSRLAEIGALIGDPGRVNMLDALMDGRALTARELAAAAGVTPQTASGHLSKLIDAGLVVMSPQGRHRYHRLASPEVAGLLESIANFASRADGRQGVRAIRTGPRDAAMRLARTCYNHFAGRLGVGIADAMLAGPRPDLTGSGRRHGDEGWPRLPEQLRRHACAHHAYWPAVLPSVPGLE